MLWILTYSAVVTPSILISNVQVQPEILANTKQHVESRASDARISQIIPDLNAMNHRVDARPQGNIGEAAVGSFLRDTVAKFTTSLKNQNTSSLLLIISIAIILLLMQVTLLIACLFTRGCDSNPMLVIF